MGGIKHMMDEAAAEMGIQDPNDQRVKTEVERRLSAHGLCPNCGTDLAHSSGLEHIPSYLYCPVCNDRAYADDGSVIAQLV